MTTKRPPTILLPGPPDPAEVKPPVEEAKTPAPRVAHTTPDRKGHVGMHRARCPWCRGKLRYKTGEKIERVQRLPCVHCEGELLLVFGRTRMTLDDALRVEAAIAEHRKAEEARRAMAFMASKGKSRGAGA